MNRRIENVRALTPREREKDIYYCSLASKIHKERDFQFCARASGDGRPQRSEEKRKNRERNWKEFIAFRYRSERQVDPFAAEQVNLIRNKRALFNAMQATCYVNYNSNESIKLCKCRASAAVIALRSPICTKELIKLCTLCRFIVHCHPRRSSSRFLLSRSSGASRSIPIAAKGKRICIL